LSLQGGHGSYDVRVWAISVYNGKRGTSYTLRWRGVDLRRQDTFPTRKLAESFRAKLVIAAREGQPFDPKTGLPASMSAQEQQTTWYELACDFVDMKWAQASPRHRKSIAEALAIVTGTLTEPTQRSIGEAGIRTALFSWSFNRTARSGASALTATPPPEFAPAVRWIEGNSLPLTAVAEARTLRRALTAIALKLDGTAAASSTVRRKRSALFSVLQYAVELELLPANPMERITWSPPPNTDEVDRRVVVNPAQARALLNAVEESIPALTAFFASLYYAGLRPAEARHLRIRDCHLPDDGWGSLLLVGSTQQAGSAWTDSGEANDDRQLKHRSTRDTRPVPACPELVAILRRHIDRFPRGPDGRLFVMRTGRAGVPVAAPFAKPLAMGVAYRTWQAARANALTEAQQQSPLARRPYDLRHACLSLWLNAGVPPTQVAEWAGHSVNVLLRVYAKCIDGQDEAAKRRIEAALQH